MDGFSTLNVYVTPIVTVRLGACCVSRVISSEKPTPKN